ncbi:hypothetical protein Ciccas_006646 [Cichlidogyrus casuarinus]|uniref:Mitochondrial thiamine pyrophosphate carrier n=1 Tax=Cichlidogyrus casuarinus TaxID=1844966 RepID=A0ABD2Q6D4_9PLAT
MSGCISGFVGRVAVQPLDVLKIRFQLQVEPISSKHPTAGKYSGFFQSIRCIYHEEGFSAFWKGHVPAQAQAISFAAVQFLSFELISQFALHQIHRSDPQVTKLPPFSNFISGCFAGACAAIATQPLDVLRTRFIAQGSEKVYSNILNGCTMIIQTAGIRGLFLGLAPTLFLIAPQTGLQFGFYNMLTSSLHKFNDSALPLTSLETLISGAMAGALAKIIVYPLDVAKKRMQVQGFEAAREKFGKVHTSSGLRECLLITVREEGLHALFKGLTPALIKSCISVGVRFSVYNKMCMLLDTYRADRPSS